MLYKYAVLLFNRFMDCGLQAWFSEQGMAGQHPLVRGRDGSFIFPLFFCFAPSCGYGSLQCKAFHFVGDERKGWRVVLGAVATAGQLHVIYKFQLTISQRACHVL